MSALDERPTVAEDDFATAHDVSGHGFTRSGFLKAGGALIVGLVAPGVVATDPALAEGDGQATNGWTAVDPAKLSAWLAVHADNTVTLYSGKVELGMGNQTSLAQLVAEQLDVPFDSVRVVMGDTSLCNNLGPTYGSQTIRVGGPQITLAAAGGRQALLKLASQHFGTPASRLQTKDGKVTVQGDSSKSVTYGQLVQGKTLQATFPILKGDPTKGVLPQISPKAATPKSPHDYSVVGKSIARVDIPLKVTGQYQYIQDVRVPGMLHGRVIRPPSLGAKLVSYGQPPAGVRVVREKDFLGVVGEHEWDVIKAAQSLKTKWTHWSGLPASDKLDDYLRHAKSQDQVMDHGGNIETGLHGSAHQLSATYDTPIETHGSIGPSCAIVDYQNGAATVYSGTQGPNAVQQSVATAMKMPLDKVRVITYPASGCYGRNGSDPVTVDAAIMSKLAGAPVRVQWMRQDEHGWDPKGPATLHELRGGVDAHGRLTTFEHQAWLPSELNVTIIGGVLSGRMTTTPAWGGWAGGLPYKVANRKLLAHNQNNIASAQDHGVGLISAWMRSPAQFQLTFAMESFIDELAHAAGADPVAFRLRHITDPRMAAALRAVAKLANWKPKVSGSQAKRGSSGTAHGRGVAVSLRDGTYDAEVADVEVDLSSGQIRVSHIYVAEDHGLTVNPRAATLGIEAGVTQSVGRVLKEELSFNRSKVTSVDWETYPIMTFSEAPKVTSTIINRIDKPSLGVGEAHCCPVPAAIGNAVFDATGARFRSMPLKPEKIKAGLKQV